MSSSVNPADPRDGNRKDLPGLQLKVETLDPDVLDNEQDKPETSREEKEKQQDFLLN